MNFSSHVSYTTPDFRTTRLFYTTSSSSPPSSLSAGIKSVRAELALTRVNLRLRSNGTKTTSCCSRTNAMEAEKEEAFYLVRKGDIVGVYRSFRDCQAQIGSSICDPPVSVYKGYSMPKETEQHLVSFGLSNAIYTIRAQDLKPDHFGKLMLCPFHEPAPLECEESAADTYVKSSDVAPGSVNVGFCTLEFDGASKGNPGLAGAGAVLRAEDGSLICKVHEGLGIKTNNVAEYRALILGLKCALKKGYTKIRVHGDSKLVCMQVQGLWKVKNQNMSDLYEEVKELKEKFVSFEISHVLRDKNSEADSQANLAVRLSEGCSPRWHEDWTLVYTGAWPFESSVAQSNATCWSAIP